MEAKEAISLAKRYVSEYLGDEGISNMGLEEITSDNGVWEVTIGFSRPWESVRDAQSVIAGAPTLQRSYNRVQIHNSSGEFIGIRTR